MTMDAAIDEIMIAHRQRDCAQHREIVKYNLRTGRMHGKPRHNLKVPRRSRGSTTQATVNHSTCMTGQAWTNFCRSCKVGLIMPELGQLMQHKSR